MKTELLTVSKIFNETIFRIPDYQRGYSWEDQHLKDFWSDLEQLVEGKNHYTGVITLEAVPAATWETWEDDTWIIQSRRYTPYYVVDGQQRLTTITILLQCILEVSKNEDLNFTPSETVRKKYIFDSKANSFARAYIFGYEKDNPSYEFLKTKIFNEESIKYSTNEETIYTRNLKKAKDFFVEKLSKFSKEDVESLYTKITQQLVFNVYEIAKEIDVFVAFETMNNRGKPLSALELLKNRLIYLATQIPDDEDNGGTQLRRMTNDSWKTVYHNLGKNDQRRLSDDTFLKNHFCLYYHLFISPDFPSDEDQIHKFMSKFMDIVDNTPAFLLGKLFTRKRLVEDNGEGLPHIDANALHQYAAHLKACAEKYFKLSTPDASEYISKEKVLLEQLGRMRGHEASPLILALYVLEKNQNKRIALLEAFERFQFLTSMRIGMQRVVFMNRYINVEAIKFMKGKIKSDELVTYYQNYVDQNFNEEHISESIQNWIKNGNGYYGWRVVNYFLFEYEVYLKNQSKTNRSKIDWAEFSKEDFQSDFVSIEHIYPQKAKSTYWTERFGRFNSTQKRLLRNSLGNLLALSSPKNASLGNKPFPEKKGREKDSVGYRYGSYSENEVAEYENWGAEDIVERGVKMLSFMEFRWGFQIGDRDQKIKALGLSFMLNQGNLPRRTKTFHGAIE